MKRKSIKRTIMKRVNQCAVICSLPLVIGGMLVMLSKLSPEIPVSADTNVYVASRRNTYNSTSPFGEDERVTKVKGLVTKYIQMTSNNEDGAEELAEMIARDYSDINVDSIDDEGVRIFLSGIRNRYAVSK